METMCPGIQVYVFDDDPADGLEPQEMNQDHLSGGDVRYDEIVHLHPLGTGLDSLDEMVLVLANLVEFSQGKENGNQALESHAEVLLMLKDFLLHFFFPANITKKEVFANQLGLYTVKQTLTQSCSRYFRFLVQ